MCGEKVFRDEQLSAGHFLHEIIDFFYHFENKVIRTIKLNFLKPGFITKENLRGVRVPYAKPVQLYLVVAVLFYLVVSKVGVSDYIPSFGDHRYYFLSDYPALSWAKPLDKAVVNGIDSMWQRKGRKIEAAIQTEYADYINTNTGTLTLKRPTIGDSIQIPAADQPVMLYHMMRNTRWTIFHAKVGTLSKSLIFLVLPFFALLFYGMFYRKLKLYGAALILSSHFLVYNLCIYTLYALIGIAPMYINPEFAGWVFLPFKWLFYETPLVHVSQFLFGSKFEMLHFIFWMPWLMIAFKRLFNTVWWKNILISYITCRVFFFLLFGILKKALIALTIWSM